MTLRVSWAVDCLCRQRVGGFCDPLKELAIGARCRSMTTTSDPPPLAALDRVDDAPLLRIAVAAYLSRLRALSRMHAELDLRAFLAWCAERRLDPLSASRPQVELYVRWMQEVRRLKPSTTSRRMSIVAGFYRTAVIDGLLEHSPAQHVRRPHVPAESPTLGLTHLQLEALLTAARQSPNRYDLALVCLLGLLGLRIFEATGLDLAELRHRRPDLVAVQLRSRREIARWSCGPLRQSGARPATL